MKGTIRNNVYFLQLIWSISPARVAHTFVSAAVDFGVWAFSSVVFTRYLFGEGSARSMGEVLAFIWGVVLLYLAADIYLAWVHNKLVPVTDARICGSLNCLLFQKVQRMDVSCYETPEFYDTYTKAATEAADRAGSVLDACARLLAAMCASLYVTVTMCGITLWALVFLVFPLLSNLYFGKKISGLDYQRDMEKVPHTRCAAYVNRVVYFCKYAGELRLTGIFGRMGDMYSAAVDRVAEIEVKYAPRKIPLSVLSFCLMFPFAFQGMWAWGRTWLSPGGSPSVISWYSPLLLSALAG